MHTHTHTYICWTVLTSKPRVTEYFPTRPALPTSRTVGTVNLPMFKLPGLGVNHTHIYIAGRLKKEQGYNFMQFVYFYGLL